MDPLASSVLIPFGPVVTLACLEKCFELAKARVSIPLVAGAEQEANRATMVTANVIDIVSTDRFNDAR